MSRELSGVVARASGRRMGRSAAPAHRVHRGSLSIRAALRALSAARFAIAFAALGRVALPALAPVTIAAALRGTAGLVQILALLALLLTAAAGILFTIAVGVVHSISSTAIVCKCDARRF